jgi:hypothetical protein
MNNLSAGGAAGGCSGGIGGLPTQGGGISSSLPPNKKLSKKKLADANSTLASFDSIANRSISSERKFFDHVKYLFTSTSRMNLFLFIYHYQYY